MGRVPAALALSWQSIIQEESSRGLEPLSLLLGCANVSVEDRTSCRFLVYLSSTTNEHTKELHRSDDADIKEDKLYYQARCRKAARAVIDFVTSLKKSEIDVFWLPCEQLFCD
jgi:hypothetical protein